ncbi:hypothetical protein RYZ27_04300 [Hyphomonas sp. FCG-A18]|uniref:MSCRAMM family protein n=1 Tax=Hyphomonas sp. FCG-A18 TaxID=3080019 RepID=UPI002B2D8DBD|nr:hypothetical protein RYZ27_04300 [Hyphomonas sp. FCG-A18]
MLRSILLVLVLGLISSVFALAVAQDEAPITAQDLEGDWVGYGYTCRGAEPPQLMTLKAIGPKVIMTKTRGDDCVPSGHRTWEGTLNGNTINGVFYVSNGPLARPIFTMSSTFTVISKNEMRSGATVFKRGEGAEAEPIPDELGAVAVTVVNARTGKPVRYQKLILMPADGTVEVGSAFLTRKDKGKKTFEALEPGQYRVFIRGDGWTEASREAMVTIKAGKTAKVTLNLDVGKVEVVGILKGYNANNRFERVKRVPVKVLFSDQHEETVYTNDRGYYSLSYDKAPEFFIVEVPLRSEKKEIDVRSRRGFAGQTVTLKSKRIEIEEPREIASLRFAKTERRLSSTLNPARKQSLEDGGAFYINTLKAADFARDKLNANYNHKLPVEVQMWNRSTSGVFYMSSDSSITVAASGNNSLRTNSSSPDNREYHEFGHHLHADMAMSGENGLPGRANGDQNHGGIDNSNSSDSYVEGFAEFFALWVNGNSVYKWGSSTDLENNVQNYRRVKRDARGQVVRNAAGRPVVETVMREEFQVAALLWDLLDSAADTGDNIDLTDKNMWAVINRVSVKDIPSLYKEVRGPLRGRKTNASQVLDDVDTLFVTHRFYSDTNGNGAWNAGEQIGVADFYHKAGSTTVRSQHPPLENSDLELVSPDGVPQAAYARTYVQYPDGSMVDFGEQQVVDGRLIVEVPENAEALYVEPIIAGYVVEPIRITPEAYEAAWAEAVISGNAVFQSTTLDAQPIEVDAPTDATIGRDQDGLWIGWQGDAGQRFILVEGAERSPLSVQDGEILYQGADPYFLVTDILDYEALRFYSIFVDAGNGAVSAPLMISWPEDYGDESGMPWWLYIIIALMAGGSLFWFFILGRRKKDDDEPETIEDEMI